MAKRIKKLNKLTGDVPFFYSQKSLYNICILLNALVDRVNYLADAVEELERRADNG